MIDIYTFADIIKADLIVRRYANQNNRWMAQFESCEVKGEGVLIGSYGNGTTPELAISAYLGEIRGHTIVFNANIDRRREFFVPENISMPFI